MKINLINILKQIKIDYALYFICFIITLSLFSQEKSKRIDLVRFKHFKIEQGLSQATINDIVQDKFGFVWLATQDGLNRFDGTEFKQFKPIKSDSTSISGNYINKVFVDSSENIWIGTMESGICYYDSKLEIFNKVILNLTKKYSENITDITQDKNGNIWVSTSTSGLFKVNLSKNGRIKSQKIESASNSFSSLYIDSSNVLWIGDFEGNVFTKKIFSKNSIIKKENIKVLGVIKSFYKTGNNLIIGSDFGLYFYNLITKRFSLIKLSVKSKSKIKFIKELLPYNKNTIWIATGSGLLLLDINTKKIIKHINNATDKKEGLSSSTVYSLLSIKNKKLLVGTANGLNILDFSSPTFNNISKDNLGKKLLNDNVVFSLLKDKSDFWIGTSDGGLNLIRNDKAYYFKENNDNPTSITGNVVRAIKKDTINNRLWLATTRGLSMIDLNTFSPSNPKFIVFHNQPNNSNSISSNFLKDIALDKDNNLWCATLNKGIFKLKMLSNNKFLITRFLHNDKNSKSLGSNFTNCIRINKNNDIWIGTKKGISKLTFDKLNNASFLNLYKNEADAKTLSNNNVYDILIDKKENIWVATRDGLNLLLENNKFKSWQKQKQFPNTIVYSIQDDDNDNLWLGTNNGLVKFNTKSQKFKHYSTADGIQSNEFNIHSKFKDDNGYIYMNGIGGVTYFLSKNIDKIDVKEPLYFSELKIKDQFIKPQINNKSVLKQALINTKEIDLKYNQFPFYLKFSSINYNFNKNVDYAYKILEQGNNWNIIKNKEISFHNLSPGKYTLQVNGYSRGKIWNQKPLEMTINITPPWYKTWWSYLIYSILLLSLFIFLHRFNLNRKLAIAENQKNIALNDLKSKMYANISHEFKTPLTLINGLSSLLIKENKNNIDQQKLNGILYSGKQLLNLVNQMLGLATIDTKKETICYKNEDIIAFLSKGIKVYQNVNYKTQKIKFTSNVSKLIMDFDGDKLQKILNNLMSNAIKFTPKKGKIHLDVIKENTLLIIKIKDTGTGIEAKHLPHIFERYYKTFDTENNLGNGIGMALTKELVELMEGTITVKSQIGKGTKFTISLPIHNNFSNTTEIVPQQPIINISREIITNNEEVIKKENSILIVEDNIAIRNFIKTLLGNTYTIHTANNGTEGLKIAKNKKIDFIISDVMMPKMNGLEFCKAIKSDIATSHIPFIIISAKTSNSDRVKGYELGIDAYLNKPFNNDELILIIKNLLEKRKDQINYFKNLLNLKESNQKISINQLDIDFIKKIQEIALNGSVINADEIASNLATSRTQLHRKIKSLTGKSITQYINHIRIEKGKNLLKNESLNINDIAYKLGFESTNYFSRVFKKETGLSPLSYRKSHIK